MVVMFSASANFSLRLKLLLFPAYSQHVTSGCLSLNFMAKMQELEL